MRRQRTPNFGGERAHSDRKVIPGGLSLAAGVVDAVFAVLAKGDKLAGERPYPGRRDLALAIDAQRLPLTQPRHHRREEVASTATVEAPDADHEGATRSTQHELLAGSLAARIGRSRGGEIELVIGPLLVAAKDKIRRDMTDRGTDGVGGARDHLGTERVDEEGEVLFAFGAIDVGIGSGVVDEVGIVRRQAVAEMVKHLAVGAGQIAGGAVKGEHGMPLRAQLLAEVAAEEAGGADHCYAHVT